MRRDDRGNLEEENGSSICYSMQCWGFEPQRRSPELGPLAMRFRNCLPSPRTPAYQRVGEVVKERTAFLMHAVPGGWAGNNARKLGAMAEGDAATRGQYRWWAVGRWGWRHP